MSTEKRDYQLPENFPMYDMCHCGVFDIASGKILDTDCITPCARKSRPQDQYATFGELYKSCSKYQSGGSDQ